jgi:sulfatase maturation enzyme AslB (radical SAM superfamily)
LSNAGKKASIIFFGGEPLMQKDLLPWFMQTALTDIDEVYGIITFHQSEYPQVWETYISRLSK